jgi:hypothetical protein
MINKKEKEKREMVDSLVYGLALSFSRFYHSVAVSRSAFSFSFSDETSTLLHLLLRDLWIVTWRAS